MCVGRVNFWRLSKQENKVDDELETSQNSCDFFWTFVISRGFTKMIAERRVILKYDLCMFQGELLAWWASKRIAYTFRHFELHVSLTWRKTIVGNIKLHTKGGFSWAIVVVKQVELYSVSPRWSVSSIKATTGYK